MNIYEALLKGTVRVECDSNRGSGFFFVKSNIVVTNHHVVENAKSIALVDKDDRRSTAKILAYSPKNEFDYAILQSDFNNQDFLLADENSKLSLGQDIVFSGFPHGIKDFLLHQAHISGFVGKNFYINGSINGGNSGGPIMDMVTGKIVGIVTQRRFLGGPELEKLSSQAKTLYDYCQSIKSRGSSVQIMGIDFGAMTSLLAEALLLNHEVLKANANSGIGIGFPIEFVLKELKKLGL